MICPKRRAVNRRSALSPTRSARWLCSGALLMFAAILLAGPAAAGPNFDCPTTYVAPPNPRVDEGPYPPPTSTVACTVSLDPGMTTYALGWNHGATAYLKIVVHSDTSELVSIKCLVLQPAVCETSSSVPFNFGYDPLSLWPVFPQISGTFTLPESANLTFTLQPFAPAVCTNTHCVSALTGAGLFHLYGF